MPANRPVPSPKPRTRNQWVAEFVQELVLKLRPNIGLKYATAIALNEYKLDLPPRVAAADWAKRSTEVQ